MSGRKDQELMDEIEVKSPFTPDVDSFNNADSFSNLKFVVPGSDLSFDVHKQTLAKASELFKETLKKGDSDRIEWPYDVSTKIDRQALIKVLRFCYGESLRVGTNDGECCAVIAVLERMEITCADETVQLLKGFAVEQGEKNMIIGTKLLKVSLQYKECHKNVGQEQHSDDDDDLPLNIQLSQVVLTKQNLEKDYKTIVEKCLMELPAEYLDIMEYGEPHTNYSEFRIRLKYIQTHLPQMSKEEQGRVMEKVDVTQLNSEELNTIMELGIIENEKMLEMFSQALEQCENERDDEKERAIALKMENDRLQAHAIAADTLIRENCLSELYTYAQ